MSRIWRPSTKVERGVLIATLSVIVAFLLFYLPFVHYTEMGEVGIMRNALNGELSVDKPGWHITAPWIRVAKVDARPMRACISTAGRGYNCKLVQFDPEHHEQFVDVEGFRYWWWSNRISYNHGYDSQEEYRGVRDILRGHAFGAEQYDFLVIVKNYDGPQ